MARILLAVSALLLVSCATIGPVPQPGQGKVVVILPDERSDGHKLTLLDARPRAAMEVRKARGERADVYWPDTSFSPPPPAIVAAYLKPHHVERLSDATIELTKFDVCVWRSSSELRLSPYAAPPSAIPAHPGAAAIGALLAVGILGGIHAMNPDNSWWTANAEIGIRINGEAFESTGYANLGTSFPAETAMARAISNAMEMLNVNLDMQKK